MRTRFSVAFFVLSLAAFGQMPSGPQPRVVVDQEIRSETLRRLAEVVESEYVIPDVAEKLTHETRAALAEDRYADAKYSGQFAQRVSRDLLNVSGDNHLRLVQRSPRSSREQPNADGGRRTAALSNDGVNYGFAEVRRLPGNVGYLDLRSFVPNKEAYKVAAETMEAMQGADALIIDLRRNNGGGPGMVGFLAGYFFEERTLLNRHYNRKTDETSELWTKTTASSVFAKTPLYLLTSSSTFSAGEGFAYALQARKRAVVVGETTGGGAHPTRDVRLHEHFVLLLPYARAVNPVTGTNWEGEGVQPDVKTRAQDALKSARVRSLEQLLEEDSASESLRADLQQARAALEAALSKPLEEPRRGPGRALIRRR